jgi:hypothetical protein
MATTVTAPKRKVLVKQVGNVTMTKPAPKKKKKGLLKRIGKGILTGGLSEVGKGGVLNKAANKLKDFTVGTTILLPLQPFKPAMKKNLEGKGISTKGLSFSKIIEKFYNENISKKKDKASNFDEIPDGFISNHYLMRTTKDNFDDSDNFVAAAATALTTIVSATIKFFKENKEKKDAAKAAGVNPKDELDPESLDAANATEQITKDLENKAKGEQPVTQANVIKYVVILAVVGAIIWFISKKS